MEILGRCLEENFCLCFELLFVFCVLFSSCCYIILLYGYLYLCFWFVIIYCSIVLVFCSVDFGWVFFIVLVALLFNVAIGYWLFTLIMLDIILYVWLYIAFYVFFWCITYFIIVRIRLFCVYTFGCSSK